MLKRLSLYTLLLALVPLFVWIFGLNAQLSPFDYSLYWITETGSMPYAIAFSALLILILCLSLKQRQHWKRVALICIASLLIAQGLKSVLKESFRQARPYVVAMAQENKGFSTEFYQQSRKVRSEIVKHFYQQSPVPHWLAKHRQHEVGYSFPSGHSIFAAGWVMLFVGFSLLYGQRYRWLPPLVALWAMLVMFSRLRLGMHYPVDLLASILLAFVQQGLIFYYLEKKQSISAKVRLE